ncbi:hypothetical protein E4T42_05660 [Aureobasidium subglaciale]|nr:hypothetical protein E4T42_05660 [Aureobasidium subglaciale]
MSSHSPEPDPANYPRSLMSNPEPTPDSNTTLDQRSRSYHQAITAMYHPFNQSLCKESEVSGLIRMSSKHLRHSILHGVKPHNGLVLCCPLENGLITYLFLILPVIARFSRLGTGLMLSRCDVDLVDLTYFESMSKPQSSVKPFCVSARVRCRPWVRAWSSTSLQGSSAGRRQQQASHESRWPVF